MDEWIIKSYLNKLAYLWEEAMILQSSAGNVFKDFFPY